MILMRQQCNPLELRNFFQSLTGYPHEHAEVFSKFGRFPGRNAAIGRPSTPQELEWLSHPDCPSWCKSQTAVAPSADVLPPVHQDYPHSLQSFPLAFAQHRNAAEFVAQAVKAAEAGLYCEAEQLFMRALALEDTAKAREMCAQVAMENDCPEAAIEHAVRAAVLQPAWPAAFITLGRACRNAGKFCIAFFFRSVFKATFIVPLTNVTIFFFPLQANLAVHQPHSRPPFLCSPIMMYEATIFPSSKMHMILFAVGTSG
jgi:hypothetical protein